MRIGIYGGSFNPIHKAHVEIVKFILKKLELDRIIIIPVGKASHRDDIMLSGELRKKMCELAFEGNEKIIISDIEIKSKKTSYTIDTLKKIISFYGGHHEFYEIVGEDAVFFGDELMYVGLNVPELVGDYAAKMWVLRKIL